MKNIGTLLGPSKLWWLLRQILQFGGMWLIANGYASEADVARVNTVLPDLFGSISFLIGFAANIYSTFRPTVTVGGEKVPIPALPPKTAAEVKTEAKAVVRERSLLERIFGQH